ncbi:MAG TPA: 3-hydroxyacyl-CoA dehydrogenase family protein [Syntrophales bacterium]|nr:3-hydroxyacyl-CoA dehydrogenase family protein [Syntrophales bacterium]HQB30728.1 3-hydroxyacyl-CoA dehydrogenase family protein [Syntrophales bacterium]HQN77075.1 3-hydroxyacyl-CoA dehydrogenase family protein [Syntrophales bacterium]HQQ26156.1 3-hydroxyacyl-CoA dehydrogenase family protein [Syntrophales bacterium]
MADKVTVIGAGTMGSGIAQVALEAGFQVILVDTEARFFERGINSIKKFIAKKVEKGKITQEKYDETVSRLSGTTDIAKAVAGAVMVVEAVFESLDLKKDIFRKIDAASGPDTVMASNTSTLSISKIAAAVSKPGRVIGTHYFSPVPLMRLVEVIRGTETSEDTVNRTMELCRKFGKTPVLVKDIPGFIVNRFLCLLYNEAANMIHDGIAKPEEIDTALKLGCNWPMGVNEIMDLAGVDVCGLAMEAMYEMTGEERYKPSPLFRKMMAENLLGRKSGKGFYEYNK